MGYGFFCDKNQKPSEKQIIEILGNTFEQWIKIDSYIKNTIKGKSAYKFYGKNYGWAIGYTKSSKSILSLYPLSNDFTIQMILKKKHENEIMKITDNKELLEIIHATPEIHEGKWIFITFSKIKSITIIKQMIDLKIK